MVIISGPRKEEGWHNQVLCDYRKLNEVSRKDSYPLTRTDDTLNMLTSSKWFSTLDLKNSYCQVELYREDMRKEYSLLERSYVSLQSCQLGLQMHQ